MIPIYSITVLYDVGGDGKQGLDSRHLLVSLHNKRHLFLSEILHQTMHGSRDKNLNHSEIRAEKHWIAEMPAFLPVTTS